MKRTMKRTMTATVVALAAVAMLAWAAPPQGEHVWISADGDEHRLHAGSHAVFMHEGGNTFDVSDLADGETRVIGQGAKQVTATRTGDEVVLSRAATADEPELRITCRLPDDSCQVVTFEDDAEKVMIVVRKTRECVHGEGDCDAALDDIDLGEGGHRIIVRKTIECDEAGDCEEHEDVSEHGDGHAVIRLQELGDAMSGDVRVIRAHGGPSIMILEDDDRTTLRCPEGDTTMRVEKKEAADVFLCPKHSVPLEKAAASGEKRVVIRKEKAAQAD